MRLALAFTPSGLRGLLAAVAALAVLAAAAPASAADDRPIEDFYGEYVGKSVAGSVGAADEDGEISPRTLNISIQPFEGGFTLAWLTITQKSSGKSKAKSYLVNFVPSPRDGIWVSAVRRAEGGQLLPPEPMSGEPYVWSSIEGDTLVTRVLLINEAGGYEIQIYERTLTADGMDLSFHRFMDGVEMRGIEGVLTKVKQ